MNHLHVSATEDILALELAQFIIDDIRRVLSVSNRYTLVLSGGNTPRKLYAQLVRPNKAVLVDWSRVHIFFGDERFVPHHDDRSNYKMAHELLLSRVPIPRHQIHPFDTSLSPEEAAIAYRQLLHSYFGNTPSSFDMVLLGMGEDAHTLSLFPHSKWVMETPSHTVETFWLEAQDMHRITLTPGIVNYASTVIFMVCGAAKRQALYMVMDGVPNPQQYPAQLIKTNHNEIHWFIDQAAASKL